MAQNFDKLINIKVNDKSLNELESSIEDINKAIKEIQTNEIKVNQSLEEQIVLQKQIEELESSKNELTKEKNKLEQKSLSNSEKIAKNLENQQQKTEKLFKVSQGLTGAFEAGAGASLLFGNETGAALEKAQAKVVALMGITNGLKDASEGLSNGFQLVSQSIQKSEKATKIFGVVGKVAMSGLGIGLIITALTLLIANFDKVVEVAKSLSDAIGLTKIIKSFTEFSDKVGGIAGLFEVAKGAVVGFTKAISNIFTKADFSGFGDTIVNETKKATEKAIIESNKIKLIKSKEGELELLKQTIEIQKAKGESTLLLEKEYINKSLELNKLKLAQVEKGSEEEIELNKEKNAILAQQEANNKAIKDETYAKNLKLIIDTNKKETILLNDKLRNHLITEDQYNEQIYQNELVSLNKQLDLNKKNGKDTLDLEVQISNLRLEHQKAVDEKIKESAIDLHDVFANQYQERLIQLQNNYESEYDFNLKKTELDRNYILTRLALEKEGTKEYLAVKKELSDFELNLKKKEIERLNGLDKYYADQRLKSSSDILNNEKNTIGERKEANKELHDERLKQLDAELTRLENNGQKETALYKQTSDKKLEIEQDFNAKNDDLNRRRIDNAFKIANAGLELASNINSLLDQQTQNSIDKINENINALSETNQIVSEQLDELNSKNQESLQATNDLESKLSESRGSRFNDLKEKLDNEKIIRQENQKKEDELTKKKIANEKKIQGEKDKIAKLELEQKRRGQAIAITQSIISTAQAVINALTVQPTPLGIVLASVVGAIGATNTALIASQKFAQGGLLKGNSHENGGIRGTGRFNNIEVEGNEFVVNKRSTMANLPLLHEINNSNGKPLNKSGIFAQGGQLPNFGNISTINTNDNIQSLSNTPIVVSVEDINSGQRRVNVIENNSSF